MARDHRVKVDVTPAGKMAPIDLASFAQGLVGKKHTENGKIIGEIRNVAIENGRLMAEVKLGTGGVILG